MGATSGRVKIDVAASLAIFLLVISGVLHTVHAQEDEDATAGDVSEPEAVAGEAAEPPPLTPLTEDEVAALDQLLEQIDADGEVIAFLESRIESTEGLIQSVTYARLDQIVNDRFNKVIELAKLISAHVDKGNDAEDYKATVAQDLAKLPAAAFAALERIGERVVFTSDDLDTVSLVSADQQLFEGIRQIDDVYQLIIDSIALAEFLELDIADTREEVIVRISDSAANRSVFLEMSVRTAANLRAGLAVLQGNEDLTGRLSAADARVRLIAGSLQRISGLMAELDLDVRRYRHQTLTATGEITTDVLDVSVVASLIAQTVESLTELLVNEGPRLIFRVLLVALIIYVFARLSRLAETLTNKALDASQVKISHLLRRMLISTGRNLIVLLGILIGLSQLGISLGPLLAGLGIAGFIIGFAMQDTLSNFASGMLILLYRPFDVGDVVDAGGVQGKVSSMSLVNTTVMTFDNQTLVVPNNLIWRSPITNFTAQHTRRVDLTFGISYDADIEKAEKIFLEVVQAHEKILDKPEPMIHLHELADSSVNFIVRPWVRTDDYWDVYWDLMRAVKLRLDAEGISIPFPQRDVHIHQVDST